MTPEIPCEPVDTDDSPAEVQSAPGAAIELDKAPCVRVVVNHPGNPDSQQTLPAILHRLSQEFHSASNIAITPLKDGVYLLTIHKPSHNIRHFLQLSGLPIDHGTGRQHAHAYSKVADVGVTTAPDQLSNEISQLLQTTRGGHVRINAPYLSNVQSVAGHSPQLPLIETSLENRTIAVIKIFGYPGAAKLVSRFLETRVRFSSISIVDYGLPCLVQNVENLSDDRQVITIDAFHPIEQLQRILMKIMPANLFQWNASFMRPQEAARYVEGIAGDTKIRIGGTFELPRAADLIREKPEAIVNPTFVNAGMISIKPRSSASRKPSCIAMSPRNLNSMLS